MITELEKIPYVGLDVAFKESGPTLDGGDSYFFFVDTSASFHSCKFPMLFEHDKIFLYIKVV